jgi:hypothetical protein
MTSMLTAPNDEKLPLFAAKDIVKFYQDHDHMPQSNLWYF